MTPTPNARLLPFLMIAGALAGAAGWALTEAWDSAVLAPRALLFLTALAAAGFTLLLALSGPVAPARAVLPSVLAGAVLAAALWWASGRHGDVQSFLELGYPLAAFGLALSIAIPFLVAGLSRPGGWTDYPALFDATWETTVRLLAGVFFAALFWGLLSLSDALLRLVDVRLLEWVTDIEAVAWALTGTVFGLALAVMFRLSGQVSPVLLLRLLRLLLPVVLVVTLVFLAALPLRGWEGLAQGFSPAAILMAVALAAVILVTVAVDRDNGEAVHSRPWRMMTGALALCVPLLAGLGGWALWLRVGQYGWTPSRLMAASVAAVLLVYGLAYALSVLIGRHWMARLRAVNTWMALAVLAICLLWLSPAFEPERTAASDQVNRARSGVAGATLPLPELAQEWGRAGQAALDVIAEARPDLTAEIELARLGRSRPAPESLLAERRAAVIAALPVYPEGATLDSDSLAEMDGIQLSGLLEACARQVTGGPGCAFYRQGEARALLLQKVSEDFVTLTPMHLSDGLWQPGGRLITLDGDQGPGDRVAALEALHRGGVGTQSRTIEVLWLGDMLLYLPE